MVRFGDGVGTSAAVLADAAEWYARERVPAAFRECRPAVLREAYRRAGGTWTRMEVCDDGGIVVHNRAVWS